MGRRLVIVWIALLAASHVWLARHAPPTPAPERAVQVAVCDDAGTRAGETMRIAYHAGSPAGAPAEDGGLPVLLLHGSPGRGSHMTQLGAELARGGRAWFAPDLPGFGDSEAWVPSYSILAHAHAMLELLDALELERVHVAGWSMGGGVALHLARLAPERVASISLLGSIGVQRAEGSGSYSFEHVKYAALYGLIVALPELVPHFGWLGPRAPRHAFVRNFLDTDQRPLEALLREFEHPTLIVQGRQDFLVPAWCAERSHELVAKSELFVFDGTHFLVWNGRGGELATTLSALAPFLERTEDAAHVALRRSVDTSTRVDAKASPQGWPLEPFELPRRTAWWWSFAVLALLSALAPIEAAALGGTALARLQVDAGLALLACALGVAARALVRGRRGWALARAPLLGALGLLPAAALSAPVTTYLSPYIGVFGADVASCAFVVFLGRGLRALARRRARD